MAIFSGVRITRTGIIFVAGIIVLAGLVGTGLWIAHNRGEQARHDETVKIAQQNLESQSQPSVSTTTTSSSNANSTNAGTVEPDSTQTQTTATTTTAPELPKTGASPTSLIVVAILALAAAFYVTSRRAVREV